jgi:hypothetical protein
MILCYGEILEPVKSRGRRTGDMKAPLPRFLTAKSLRDNSEAHADPANRNPRRASRLAQSATHRDYNITFENT